MTSYPQPLARGAIPTSPAVAYSVPLTLNNAILSVIAFTNTTAAPLTVTLNIVPAGDSAQTGNQVYSAQVIAANTMSFDDVPLPLIPGDQIVWVASGSGLAGNIGGTLN